MTRGFVPRAGRRRVRSTWGWDVALAGWSKTHSDVVAAVPAAVVESERTALVRTTRKFAKRVARVRVARAAGPVRTARPVGTRMGKGKGKPAGHRGWTPAGAVMFELVGSARAARRVAVLAKRSSNRVVRVERFY